MFVVDVVSVALMSLTILRSISAYSKESSRLTYPSLISAQVSLQEYLARNHDDVNGDFELLFE